MVYANSYSTDSNFKPGDFVLSSVNSTMLKKYGIKESVKDFKARVKNSRNYKVIVTGGAGYSCHTRVYNYEDFKQSGLLKPVKPIPFDFWWNET